LDSQVVFAELNVTPGILAQCEDRAHRIGQLNAINVHYLVAKGTVDEAIWKMVARKLGVVGMALDGEVAAMTMFQFSFELINIPYLDDASHCRVSDSIKAA
jgi:SNF2 family DNA or RNA helicase